MFAWSSLSRTSHLSDSGTITRRASSGCSLNQLSSRAVGDGISEAENEAAAIIADARAEAERVAAEARVKMEEFVARRTKLAEAKIGQAEAQALADVRAAAADAAVNAAEKILRDTAKGQIADNLIAQGIADVKAKLN